MKGNHLSAQKVLTVSNTLGDLNNLVTLVVNDLVGGLFAVLVIAFLNLEPAVANTAVSLGISNLLEIRHDGTL